MGSDDPRSSWVLTRPVRFNNTVGVNAWTRRGCSGHSHLELSCLSSSSSHPKQLAETADMSTDVTASHPRGAESWAFQRHRWGRHHRCCCCCCRPSLESAVFLSLFVVVCHRRDEHGAWLNLVQADETSTMLISSCCSPRPRPPSRIETVTEGASVGHLAAREHQHCCLSRFISRGHVQIERTRTCEPGTHSTVVCRRPSAVIHPPLFVRHRLSES